MMDQLSWTQYTKDFLRLGSPKWDMVSRCGLVVVPGPALQVSSLSQDVTFAFAEFQEGPVGLILLNGSPAPQFGVAHKMPRPTVGSGNPRDKPQEARKKKGIKLLKSPRAPHMCRGHCALAIGTSRWVLSRAGGAW